MTDWTLLYFDHYQFIHISFVQVISNDRFSCEKMHKFHFKNVNFIYVKGGGRYEKNIIYGFVIEFNVTRF